MEEELTQAKKKQKLLEDKAKSLFAADAAFLSTCTISSLSVVMRDRGNGTLKSVKIQEHPRQN